MRRPNILFITTDQQHPDALGLFDARFVTPNLDRLAREGTAYTRSYSSSPLCTPARATWLTGRYPFSHGAWSVGTSLDPDCTTLPALLAEFGGYRTAIIGKSHLQAAGQADTFEGESNRNDTAFFRRWSGPWYGFDYAQINVGHVDEPHSASMHYRAWLEDRGVDIDRYFRKPGDSSIGPAAWSLPAEHHPAAWVTDRTVDFLSRHVDAGDGRPFFLSVNFPEPHRPFKVPQPWYDAFAGIDVGRPKRRWNEWQDKSTIYNAFIEGRVRDLGVHGRIPPASMADQGRFVSRELADRYAEEEAGRVRTYAAMVAVVDEQVGKILARLDELGLSNDTLVVFTSDHGDYLGEHFIWSKGAAHYDGCVRVPTLVKWPGRVQAGAVSRALVSTVDIAPTVLDAAGVSVPEEMQGVSQLPVFTGARESVRHGVLVDHRAEEHLYVNSWITDRYRLSVYHYGDRGRGDTPPFNEVELFDLETDPREFENAAPGEPGLVSSLLMELLAERSRVSAPWQPRLSFA